MRLPLVRVVKVGGSLFEFPKLVSSLTQFLDQQPSAATVLIAGGGPWADAVRDVYDVHSIDEPTAHKLCIRAMSVTARLLATLVPQCALESRWRSLLAWTQSAESSGKVRVLDTEQFLAEIEPGLSGHALPRRWSATSDSIAARVARGLNATDLVLLKSASPCNGQSLEQAAEKQYVDRFFPQAIQGLRRVCCVNLRDPGLPEAVWKLG